MVLVFGPQGFIGGHLRKDPGFVGCGEDVTHPIDPDGIWHGVEAVVNLACVQPARGKFSLQQYIDVNVKGLINVLDFARASGINKVLTMASQKTSLKGEIGKLVLTDQMAINVMQRYHQEYGMQTIVLRIPPAFGPGPFIKGRGLGVFMENAAKNEPIEVWGNPLVYRSIISVHDVVSAIQALLKNDEAEGVYVTSGIGLTLEDEVRVVNAVYGNRSEIVYKPEIPNGLETERCGGVIVPYWRPKWGFRDIVEEVKNGTE